MTATSGGHGSGNAVSCELNWSKQVSGHSSLGSWVHHDNQVTGPVMP